MRVAYRGRGAAALVVFVVTWTVTLAVATFPATAQTDSGPAFAATRAQLYVAPGVVTYGEHFDAERAAALGRADAFDFVADAARALAAGVAVAVAATPTGEVVLALGATLSSTVDMQATQAGVVVQRNQMSMELFDGALAWRQLVAAADIGGGVMGRWWIDGGYRGTLQRLHFVGVPGIGGADETVQAHGLEVGTTVALHGSPTAPWLSLRLAVGGNRGRAVNSQIAGANLHAGGYGFSIQPQAAFHTGSVWLLAGVLVDFRRQVGGAPTTGTFQGVPVRVIWPENDTLRVLGTLGVSFAGPAAP